ncbi:hypothetical protein KRX54_06705 [Actinomycetaceae bacterium TAE3-ERU4]|nr:hypothetical protein [Actinomycetaceae bacterium TAE3-ERU4]
MIYLFASTPDGPTASGWATRELSHWRYKGFGASWIEAILRFFNHLKKIFFTDSNASGNLYISIAVVLALIVLTIAILSYRNSHKDYPDKAIFDSPQQAEDLEAFLTRYLAKEEWEEAYITQYRILVCNGIDTGLVLFSPSLTAIEAAENLNQVSEMKIDFLPYAKKFNGTRFGTEKRTKEDFETLQEITNKIFPKKANK